MGIEWRPVVTWVLEGTYLEVRPEAAGAWVVVDVRFEGTSLGLALSLEGAKARAELLSVRKDFWRKR